MAEENNKKPARRRPRRRKKTPEPPPPPEKSRKRKFFERAGIAALKGAGSASMGAGVGAIEEAVSEQAADVTKGVLAFAGMAGEVFLDPEAHPILSETAKASLHSGSALAGYKAGKKATKAVMERKREADQARVKEQLLSELETREPQALPAGEEVVPIEKQKRKRERDKASNE